MGAMVRHLIVNVVIALVVAIYPVSASGATSLHGFNWSFDQIEQTGIAVGENPAPHSHRLHLSYDPDCGLTECSGHEDQSGDGPGSMECCTDYCVATMALTDTARDEPYPHHQSHFARPQDTLSAGVWATPERPPGF